MLIVPTPSLRYSVGYRMREKRQKRCSKRVIKIVAIVSIGLVLIVFKVLGVVKVFLSFDLSDNCPTHAHPRGALRFPRRRWSPF